MIGLDEIRELSGEYDKKRIKVGVLASHSALDAADGAVEEGFKTILYCQKGRERTYETYFKAKREDGNLVRGCVDECIVYDKFNMLMAEKEQEKMRDKNVLFIPNRSFTSYIPLNKIEDDFKVPLVGSRNLLRTEERGETRDYYWMLEQAGLPFPERIKDPKDINELCIVKLHHAKKKLERGFFTVNGPTEYHNKSQELLRNGVITEDALSSARIERYIIGPVFNLDFFYNPLAEKNEAAVELLGIDWRFETSLDGYVRLPAKQQWDLSLPEYTVCGHNSATLRESLLERAFELAEKWVAAAAKHYKPGIIGAFCLQTCVDKDLNFYIYDVAPRIGGGTNVHMNVGHAYGNALYHANMSTGRRTARMIREAVEQDSIEDIIT